MQQRHSVIGRPSGTDGSDFSYRMVVDSRYTKVAQGKSRLYSLFVTQAISQLIGMVYTYLLTSLEGPNKLAISSVIVGFISLLVGELGRRQSRMILLKVYMVGSSIALLLSVPCVVDSYFLLQVFQDPRGWEGNKIRLLGTVCILFGLLLQIFTVSTVTSLICNMSPPKKAS